MTRYSKEFKEQAMKLSDEIGVKKASEQLGIVYCTLADWRKSRNRNHQAEETANDTSPLTVREKQMMKEMQELRESNQILKDALYFFAKDRKK
jgi:transposase